MLYVSDFKSSNKKQTDDQNRRKNSRKKVVKEQNSWKGYINELLDEYCQFGSLHGLRYIREPSIPRVERFLWLGIILACLYASALVVWDEYTKGVTQDFTLDINPKNTPIWDIPFPAVLVCSSYPIRKSVFDIAKEIDNVKYKHFSKMVCPNRMAFDSEVFNETIDHEFFEFIRKAAIPCQELIVNCYWQGKKRDCCTYFRPILTLFGFCYIFNSLPGGVKYKHFSSPPGVEVVHDNDYMFWSMAYGYPRREGRQAKLVRPLWSEYTGPRYGFSFDIVDVREEWQEACSGSLRGCQLFVYPPNKNFEAETSIRIPHNEHSHIKLSPSLFLAEDNLRAIDRAERECVFSDEVQLDYFNQYSQSSCQIECFIQKVLRVCGCAPYSTHRMIGVYNHPYCNDLKYDCMVKVLDDIIATPPSNKEEDINEKCTCVPVCTWLSYDYQISFQQIVTDTTLPPWSEGYNESLE